MRRVAAICLFWMALGGCAVSPAEAQPQPAPAPTPAPPAPQAPAAPKHDGFCVDSRTTQIWPPATDRREVTFRDGSSVTTGPFWYCDSPSGILLVGANHDAHDRWSGPVLSIPRAHPERIARGTIRAGSRCTDPCGGPEGGWAGCSYRTTCDIRTSLSVARRVTTGYPAEGSALGVAYRFRDARGRVSSCGPQPWSEDEHPVAICSTRAHTVTFAWANCDPVSPTGGVRLVASVFAPGAPRIDADGFSIPEFALPGGLEGADQGGRTYRFPDPAAKRDITLVMTDGKGAQVRIGDQLEACLAFGHE